jgi:phage tail protein X
MSETVTIQGEGLTLDHLLWRRFGLSANSLLEEADRLNPGIASLSAILPLGTKVVLPASTPEKARAAAAPAVLQVVRQRDPLFHAHAAQREPRADVLPT